MKAPAESTLQHIVDLMHPVRNYRQHLEEFVADSEFVVFYGCGRIFHSIRHVWNEYIFRKIDCICDRDPRKWGTLVHGIRCISPEELLQLKGRCAVFVTVGDVMPVWNFLHENGFDKVSLLYKYDLLNGQTWSREELKTMQTSLAETYEMLADEESKTILDAMIRRFFHGDGSPDCMGRFNTHSQYFSGDPVPLSDRECVVDIGAYDGDTLRDFLQITGERFERYYAFELCRNNFDLLNETVAATAAADRIQLFLCGVGDRHEEITYLAAQSESRIGGDEPGVLDTLDHILPTEKVTLIKMDIEGYEMKALKGAEKTIRTWKPKLAICVYHELRHWWEVPAYIKSLVPEYNIYLRHHSPLEYETVCYAVCPDRSEI